MCSCALTDGIGFVLTKFPSALHIVNVQPHRNNRAHHLFNDTVVHFIAGPWGLGQKLVLNEFVAYIAYLDIAGALSPITQAIVVFALCGFANFSSIAILLGGLGALAPTRRDDISRLGLRALLTATLANLMSAALAGFFLSFQ